MTHGMERMLDRGPNAILRSAPDAELDDLDVFGDGGIRDLFMAGPAANHTFSAFPSRQRPLRYHNGYPPFHLDGRDNDPENFIFTEIDWLATGQNVLVRYGAVDTTPARLQGGDGAHVGSIEQAVNRVLAPRG
nr:hypothetical protein [Actinomycetota bacterium]NIW33624.1 hypothetical protein [Actinomycetota bacterium]